jgi:glycerol-3-phosphate dehydrogenase
VKGSHIVVPQLYDGDHAFLLQNPDRRVVFAIPYEERYTLIGTTDEIWREEPGPTTISPGETAYLLDTIKRYFERPVSEDDIVWSYSGIRPLYDDKATSASAVTRDYVLDLDEEDGLAPVLSVFGGKITTYRKLAEHALEKLQPFFSVKQGAWTAGVPLPGGSMPNADFESYFAGLKRNYPGMPSGLLRRFARAYGTRTEVLLGNAQTPDDLGRDFGGGLYQYEVDYLVDQEWARSAEDVLFRRSKLGLHVSDDTVVTLTAYLNERGATSRAVNKDPI